MAVTRISNKAEGWEGGASSERNGLLYEVIRRRYRLTKLVYVSDPGDGPEVILTSPGIPVVGDSYALYNDSDDLATCISVTPRRTQSPLLWEVECEFDTDRIISAATDNPLNQPADIRWTFAKYEKPLLRTWDGIPVVNSVGDAYDPAVTWEDARPTCTIVRNEAAFSPTHIFQFIGSLNLETFATAPPLFAKIVDISGQLMWSNGLQYAQVTYQIELCRDGYALPILDQGWRDSKGNLFRDAMAQAYSNPTLLNGVGGKLTSAVTMLALAMSNTDTVAHVVDGSLFPPGAEPDNAQGYMPSGDGFFIIKIDNELMQVTTRKPVGIDWQVTRGFGGTTAAAHSAGARVTLDSAYFKRFIPSPVKSWSPLALPVV